MGGNDVWKNRFRVGIAVVSLAATYTLVRRHFFARRPSVRRAAPPADGFGAESTDITVSSLHVYPVKSMRGHAVPEAEVDGLGFINDRRWVVALSPDSPSESAPPARFLTQRQLPQLATLTPYVLTRAALLGVRAHIERVRASGRRNAVSGDELVEVAAGATRAAALAARRVNETAMWEPDASTWFPVASSSARLARAAALLITVDRVWSSRGLQNWVLVPLVRVADAVSSARGREHGTFSPAGSGLRSVRVWDDVVDVVVDQGDSVAEWLRSVLVDPFVSPGEPDTYGVLAPTSRIRLLYIDEAAALSARPLVSKHMPLPLPQPLIALLNPSSARHAVAQASGAHRFMLSVLARLLEVAWALCARGSAASQVSFADGYPLLLANTASLADLNAKMSARGVAPVPMARFRPNIVVTPTGDPPLGAPSWAWSEDSWSDCRVQPSQLRLRGVKRCSRCAVTTTDQTSGVRDTLSEPLATLMTFRGSARPGSADVFFGMNMVHDIEPEIDTIVVDDDDAVTRSANEIVERPKNVIRVGDKIVVTRADGAVPPV